tara:strand:- start:718 stop:849 length:132 start_codon:yes stop_codon:yes gene_type:complete
LIGDRELAWPLQMEMEDWKEREGKERKGKERKGKERKGKEGSV